MRTDDLILAVAYAIFRRRGAGAALSLAAMKGGRRSGV